MQPRIATLGAGFAGLAARVSTSSGGRSGDDRARIGDAGFGRISLSGLPAWLPWGAVHIFFLIGFRNRVIVMMSWLGSYFAAERGARLITGTGREL